MKNGSKTGTESNKRTEMESNRGMRTESKVRTEIESKDGTERRGLGEIKVKVQNRKVIKAQKQNLVKMVYNNQSS